MSALRGQRFRGDARTKNHLQSEKEENDPPGQLKRLQPNTQSTKKKLSQQDEKDKHQSRDPDAPVRNPLALFGGNIPREPDKQGQAGHGIDRGKENEEITYIFFQLGSPVVDEALP